MFDPYDYFKRGWIDVPMEVLDKESMMKEEQKILDFVGKVDGGGVREGQKGEKPNTHFLVKEFLYGIARVMMHGAKKYAPWNWQRGMKYSDTYSSLQRHLLDWWQRDDNDDGVGGSGLPHLWHAGCDLMFLVFYEAHRAMYGSFDDRPLKPNENNDNKSLLPSGIQTITSFSRCSNWLNSCQCIYAQGHVGKHWCGKDGHTFWERGKQR